MDQAYVIRHKVLVEGISVRRVAREMGVSRNTVRRYVDSDAKPGVRRQVARGCPVRDRERPLTISLTLSRYLEEAVTVRLLRGLSRKPPHMSFADSARLAVPTEPRR